MSNIIWTTEKRKIKDLKDYPKNPRKITEKGLSDLEKSIENIGFIDLIAINTDNTILGGHARKKVLKKLGIKEIDCRVPNRQLTDKEMEEAVIRLNKNIAGEFDFDILANAFEQGELIDWGFEIADFGIEPEAVEGLTDEDCAPEAPANPISVLGDLWILGNHRLLCGDSTKIDDVEKLMQGEKADMVFTDPPYGMHLKTEQWNTPKAKGRWCSNKKDYANVIGDGDDFTPELINTIFSNFSYCKEIFIWGADYFAELIPNKNAGSWISWDKRFGLEGVEWTSSEFELCWSKQKHQRKIARIKWFGLMGMEKDDTQKRVHPTQKPTLLIEWFFEQWGKQTKIVVDLFGGSGSTLIACEKTNRKARLMELDEKYVDVIIKRWQEFSGKKATHAVTGKEFGA